MSICAPETLVICFHSFVSIIIVTIFFESQSTSTTEKRPLAEDESDSDEEPRKKQKPADIPVTESILDDICIEEIETRISVHVIETPEACTHEVAVYPGEHFLRMLGNIQMMDLWIEKLSNAIGYVCR